MTWSKCGKQKQRPYQCDSISFQLGLIKCLFWGVINSALDILGVLY